MDEREKEKNPLLKKLKASTSALVDKEGKTNKDAEAIRSKAKSISKSKTLGSSETKTSQEPKKKKRSLSETFIKLAPAILGAVTGNSDAVNASAQLFASEGQLQSNIAKAEAGALEAKRKAALENRKLDIQELGAQTSAFKTASDIERGDINAVTQRAFATNQLQQLEDKQEQQAFDNTLATDANKRANRQADAQVRNINSQISDRTSEANLDRQTLEFNKLKEQNRASEAKIKNAAKAAGKDVKRTESQSKSMIFGTRMVQAEQDLQGLINSGFDVSATELRAMRLAPREAQSPQFQQMQQAKSNFINAVLRRESGAVISESEMSQGEQQYFPMPGDTEEVLAQKERNRRVAIDLLLMDGKLPREEAMKIIGSQDISSKPQSKNKTLNSMTLEEKKALARQRGLIK